MEPKQKCYMCDRDAVSMEHVPPQCLFPEQKDTRGLDFRKNLITVPSCNIHNSRKSDDDEFLLLSLVGLINNNPIGQYHKATKANRAIRRKGKDFIGKQVLRNHKYGIFKTENNIEIISVGLANGERLYTCFEHISHGLYYHNFGEKFDGEVRMILGFVEYEDKNSQVLKKFLKRRFEVEDKLNYVIKGSNPEVFYYQFYEPDENGLIALKLVFYGTAEVYVAFKGTDAKEPFDLGMKLMQSGIRTTFKIGDEEFKFNE